ncbi:shufflon protein B [Salmonella enterica]|nr:shufflon protein B [Salmonella enterica]
MFDCQRPDWHFSQTCQSGRWQKVGDGDVQVVSVTAEAWRFPSATAWCPAGKKVTGGGANCFTPGGSIWLVHSTPAGDNGWVATCDTTQNKYASIIVHALCR